MSQGNMEVIEALYRAINRHDAQAILALCAPDIEIVSGLLPDERRVRGHEGVRAYRASPSRGYGAIRSESRPRSSSNTRTA